MRSQASVPQRFFLLFLLCSLCFGLAASVAQAQIQLIDDWKIALSAPDAAWQANDFDDQQWQSAPGGFGTRETPASRVGTVWQSNDIWARKHFNVTSVPPHAALYLHHDEDAEVYLNGQLIAALEKWSTDYVVVPLQEDARELLQLGDNLLAVHCHQSSGGQFIDVHVIDADNIPKLPRPKRDSTPFQSALITEWGADVNEANAWREYPRPQLVRENWTNLNGYWNYAISPVETDVIPTSWAGQILVPFCLESKIGGVQRLLEDTEVLWYQRTFEIDAPGDGHVLLNFEAVDYRCSVFVNGQIVGEHRGGNDPFSCDITSAIRSGANELVVRVQDATEGWQLNGKQSLNPRGIWYTQVSGIWQTVWLENVPATYVEDISIATDATAGTIKLTSTIVGTEQTSVQIEVFDGEHPIVKAVSASPQTALTVKLDAPKLWSPRSPNLYRLVISLLGSDGQVIDQVESYAGIRTTGKVRDADGNWRFTLNGETIFHWGPLDQGWWPDGLLTPPSDEAMLFDIEFLKSAGFNMIRKHIKVEPRRYYYHCDRIGMLVWQDQVSGGKHPNWTRLDPMPLDAEWPSPEHNQFLLEFDRMIDNLENHPSIVVWTPFNEAWGQHQTLDVGQWATHRDPSRLINIASGGNFWPIGDIVDQHNYPDPDFPFDPNRYANYIKVVGEFGGHGFPVPGHLWDSHRDNWGYGGLPKSLDEYKSRYVTSLEKLDHLRQRGIAAGVYTQTTDVEGEINGLMTYDRKVIKIPAVELAGLHALLFKN